MSKKPDRWERMAHDITLEHIAAPFAKQIPMECWPSIEHRIAIKLRKEHKAVVRIIQAMQANSWSFNEVDAYVNGYQRATYDILSKLTERAK